jgi:hypothetical protein
VVEQAASHNSGSSNSKRFNMICNIEKIVGKQAGTPAAHVTARGTSCTDKAWDHQPLTGSAAAHFIELQQNCKQSWLTWRAQHIHWRTSQGRPGHHAA